MNTQLALCTTLAKELATASQALEDAMSTLTVEHEGTGDSLTSLFSHAQQITQNCSHIGEDLVAVVTQTLKAGQPEPGQEVVCLTGPGTGMLGKVTEIAVSHNWVGRTNRVYVELEDGSARVVDPLLIKTYNDTATTAGIYTLPQGVEPPQLTQELL